MKIKALLLFLGISMSHSFLSAQNKEFKFGKISPQEFETKASGEDSAAAAIKLFDVGSCRFEIGSQGVKYVFDRHVRYKIMNKNGYDYANYKIGLYRGSGGKKEDLSHMEASTYNLVDGKMVTSKIGKDAKFTEELNKQYSYKKFTLPNVKEGSIIEFKYTIKSDFLFNLRGWSFQSEVPTLYSEYNVTIPEYFSYKVNHGGILPINRTKHEWAEISLGELRVNSLIEQYTLANTPALKEEAYITTLEDYRPTIDFELLGTRFPNELHQDFTGTWPKIVESLVTDENFGSFVNKSSYAKTLLPSIVKEEKDSLAIMGLIFKYVKEHIKWNGQHDNYTSETNPKVIFDKKAGNSADINLCLISLLKAAKFNVNPVLVSTRENGFHPGYPSISKFNNVIGIVNINNTDILLDATERDMQIGMVGYDNLNHQFFLVDLAKKNGKWFFNEASFNYERIFNYNLVLDKENRLKGTLSQFHKGYAALNLRSKYRAAANEAEFLNNFKKNKTGLSISNYKIANLDDTNELLIESMEVDIEDNVEEAGNLVYFTPLLFEKTKENLFKHDKRDFPVDFGHPIKESYRITLQFPSDYEIDKLPAGGLYKLPDNKGTFSINFVKEGQSLMVKSSIDLSKTVYTPDEYFNLKELFKAVVEKQAEQIVFKKKV